MKLLPNPSYVLGVNHVAPAFSVSNGRPVTRWQLLVGSRTGTSKVILSHDELYSLYTEKSDPLFMATAHRDISKSVFFDRRVIINMTAKYPEKKIVSENKQLTGKWKLGVDLDDVYRHEHMRQLQELTPKPKILVKYYFNGDYYEKEIEAKYLDEFITYRGIVYSGFKCAALRA
jgi:hypothetical protein